MQPRVGRWLTAYDDYRAGQLEEHDDDREFAWPLLDTATDEHFTPASASMAVARADIAAVEPYRAGGGIARAARSCAADVPAPSLRTGGNGCRRDLLMRRVDDAEPRERAFMTNAAHELHT